MFSVLGIWVLVVVVQLLGKSMVIGHLDSEGKFVTATGGSLNQGARLEKLATTYKEAKQLLVNKRLPEPTQQ